MFSTPAEAVKKQTRDYSTTTKLYVYTDTLTGHGRR